MNKEICEKTMENFLLLDKNERLPLKITLHLLACKKCRSQVHYLSLAEKYASQPVRFSIKEKLENMEVEPVSMTKWIAWGIIMILLMVTFGIFLNRLDDGTSFSIIFNVIFGLLITVYCALFVGTNMDFFVKKIDKIQAAV